MKSRCLSLIFLLYLPIFVNSQITLSGVIRDERTDELLAGAHITLKNTSFATISRPDGSFTIPDLKQQTVQLKVTFLGYEDFLLGFDLTVDKYLDIRMVPKAIMEEEVVILATRASEKSPATFQNISSRELREVNLGKDLPFLLETSPGTVATSDAGNGIGYTAFRIRGTDLTRINVTLNGIPLNDPESQAVYWVDLPDFASSVDNVQIQRGVGTSTNGAAAFGASINFQTTRSSREPYATINSSFGSYRSLKNTLLFGTGLIKDNWSFDGRLSRISSDGYIDRASSELKSFFVSGAYQGHGSLLKINIFSGDEKTYQAWNGVPGDSLETNRTYNPSGEYVNDQGEVTYYPDETDNYRQDHYQLIYSQIIKPTLSMSASLFYIRGFGYYENYKSDQDFNDYGFDDVIVGNDTITTTDLVRRKYLDNDYVGMTFSVNHDDHKKLKMNFGTSLDYYTGDHYGTVIWAKFAPGSPDDARWYDNTGIKKQFNFFTKAGYQLNKHINIYGDLQLRYINYEISGTHDDLRDISQQHNFLFFNPKFGGFFDLDHNNKAYFSVAVAGREPTRNDFRDADDDHLPLAEHLTDIEAGYNYQNRDIRLDANLFFMQYKNQLVLTGEINNVGSPIFSNVPDSYRAGIEVVFGWKINEHFSLEPNISLSNNKIKEFTEYVDNWSEPYGQIEKQLGKTDISFSPGIIAGNIFSFEPINNLNLKLFTKYVGSQFIDNTSSEQHRLDSYLVNDLRVTYSFTTRLIDEIALFVNVNNILSEEYETNAWIYRYNYEGREYHYDGYFPQAPINFMTGISFSFK